MVDREEILRRVTLGDMACLDELIASRHETQSAGHLTYRDDALIRLGALAGLGGSDLMWLQAVSAAIDAGLTPDEIVDALLGLAPMIGSARLIAITPKVSLAIGYDVESAIEAPGPCRSRPVRPRRRR